MAHDFVEELCGAITTIVEHKLHDQKFDETLICTIIDTSDAKNGHYIVSNGSLKFDVYSDSIEYKKDESVRVSVAKGDYSQKKYIIGKAISEKNGGKPLTYTSPSTGVLDMTGNLFVESLGDSPGTIANGGNDYLKQCIWSVNFQDSNYQDIQNNSIYDAIVLKADFKTLLNEYNLISGNYGLELKIYLTTENAPLVRTMRLDSTNMFGDPYNFLIFSNQEAKFSIDQTETITAMSLYLYQDDNFYYRAENGAIEKLVRSTDDIVIKDILVSNIYIGFGTNLINIDDNKVVIYTHDELKYNIVTDEASNYKNIGLIWYNKDENNKYIGFSDGLVSYDKNDSSKVITYDEREYVNKTNQNIRLESQLKKANIPNDKDGLWLSADLEELKPLLTKTQDTINKTLNTELKGLQKSLTPLIKKNNVLDTLFNAWLDVNTGKMSKIASALEQQDSEDINENLIPNLLNYYIDGLACAAAVQRGKGTWIVENEQDIYQEVYQNDSNGEAQVKNYPLPTPLSALKTYEQNLMGPINNTDPDGVIIALVKEIRNDFLPSIKQFILSNNASYLGSYDNYATRIETILSTLEKYQVEFKKLIVDVNNNVSTTNYDRFTKEVENNLDQSGLLIRINKNNAKPIFHKYDLGVIEEELKEYNNKYSIYWYYYDADYYDKNDSFGEKDWHLFTISNLDNEGNIVNENDIVVFNKAIEGLLEGNIGLSEPNDKYYFAKALASNKQSILNIKLPVSHAIEKIKAVLVYNHEVFNSNIIEFTNDNYAPDIQLKNSIEIEHGTNSMNTYAKYGVDNILIDNTDYNKTRQLILNYRNEDGDIDNSLLDGASVYWYVPTNATMLKAIQSDMRNDSDTDTISEFISAQFNVQYEVQSITVTKTNGEQTSTINIADIINNNFTYNSYTYKINANASEVVAFKAGENEAIYSIVNDKFTANGCTFKIITKKPIKLYRTETRAAAGNIFTYNGREYSAENPPANREIEFRDSIVIITENVVVAEENGIYTFTLGKDNMIYEIKSNEIICDGESYRIKNGVVTLPISTAVDSNDIHHRDGYVYFYKKLKGLDGKISDAERSFYYRIKDYYSASYTNNTIYCKVVQKQAVLNNFIAFNFSTFGSNGTNYTFNITPKSNSAITPSSEQNNGEMTLVLHNYDFELSLYDYNNNPIEFFDSNITYQIIAPHEMSESAIGTLGRNVKNTNSLNAVKTIDNNNVETFCYYRVLKASTKVPWISQQKELNSDAIVTTDTTLTSFRVIPYALNSSYYIEGPSTVIYDAMGGNPSYYKNPFKLFETNENGESEEVKNVEWTMVYYKPDGHILTAEEANSSDYKLLVSYMPSLTAKKDQQAPSLVPCNMFLQVAEEVTLSGEVKEQYALYPVVEGRINGELIWAQPIYLMQNRFPSAMLNNWDGKLEIDEENGIILSNLVGAGKKNQNNSFSGVLMGEIESKAGIQADGYSNPERYLASDHTGIGLYGFHEGAQSFGFNINGTAFLGKSGGGRISFDGNHGFIYSQNWLNSFKDNEKPFLINNGNVKLGQGKAGMAIDLQNGHIDAYNFRLTSNGIQLNSSPVGEEDFYFLVGDQKRQGSFLSYTKDGTLWFKLQKLVVDNWKDNQGIYLNGAPDSGGYFLKIGNANNYIKFGTKLDFYLQDFILDAWNKPDHNGGVYLNSNPSSNGYYFQIGKSSENNYLAYSQEGKLLIQSSQFTLKTQSIYISDMESNYSIGGAEHPVVLCMGSNFGISADGTVYASNMHIKGGSISIQNGNDSVSLSTGSGGIAISGKLIANTDSLIGGWNIASNGIYRGDVGIYSSWPDANPKEIAGYSGSNWRFIAGDSFGVDKDGNVYASKIHFTSGIESSKDNASVKFNGWNITSERISYSAAMQEDSGPPPVYTAYMQRPDLLPEGVPQAAFAIHKDNTDESDSWPFWVRYNGDIYCQKVTIEHNLVFKNKTIEIGTDGILRAK